MDLSMNEQSITRYRQARRDYLDGIQHRWPCATLPDWDPGWAQFFADHFAELAALRAKYSIPEDFED